MMGMIVLEQKRLMHGAQIYFICFSGSKQKKPYAEAVARTIIRQRLGTNARSMLDNPF